LIGITHSGSLIPPPIFDIQWHLSIIAAFYRSRFTIYFVTIVGNELKSFDLKSGFRTNLVIFWFWFNHFQSGDFRFLILFYHLMTDFDFCHFKRKIPRLQNIKIFTIYGQCHASNFFQKLMCWLWHILMLCWSLSKLD